MKSARLFAGILYGSYCDQLERQILADEENLKKWEP